MNNGYIMLSRAIIDSDVFASQKMLKIWVWCLCRASYKNRSIPLSVGKGERIININRGQFVFGRHKAEEELFIDGSTIYKCMQKLQELGNIKIESSNQYSVVTICNFDKYQDPTSYKVTADEQPSNNQVTTNEQPSNTNNKDNKDNKDNNISIEKKLLLEERQLNFKTEVEAFHKQYDIELLRSFYNFWSEATKDKKKMKMELEKTWETSKRLATWYRNSIKKWK